MLRHDAVLFSRSPRSRLLQDYAHQARPVCADCVRPQCFIHVRGAGCALGPLRTGHNEFFGGCDRSALSRSTDSAGSSPVTASHLI